MATSSKTPVVNYTPEMTAEMVEMYVNEKLTVEAIAEKIGKSVRSVVAKLSREKVYVKKVATSKTGEVVTHKAELASAIGAVLQLTDAEIEGLEKATKTGLQKIFSALANSKPL